MIETMPGGIAVFDYNGDGRPDIYFTNGADVPSLEKTSAKYWNRLYRNDGDLKFTRCHGEGRRGREQAIRWARRRAITTTTDIPTCSSPASIATFSIAIAGNGTFEDVTAKAGIKSGEWAVAAGWFDYDNDGKLDLLGGALCEVVAAEDRYCGDRRAAASASIATRNISTGLPITLYRNRGDGTFEDVSAKAGIGAVFRDAA